MSYFFGVNNCGRDIAADAQVLNTHVSNTNNPHVVTSSQVGNNVPQWDANKLQSVNISSTAPTSDQLLAYDSGASQWEPLTFSAATPLSYASGNLSVAVGSSSGTVCAGNDPRLQNAQNTVYVKKNPAAGQFSTITAAIASIPVSPAAGYPSSTNRYCIFVYPGDYSEPPMITPPSFTFIVGIDMRAVRVTPSATGAPLFNLIHAISGLAFLTVFNADPAYPAIRMHNCGDYVLLHKIELEGCDRGYQVLTDSSNTSPVLAYLEFCNTVESPVYSLSCNDSGNAYGQATAIEDFFTYGAATTDIIVDGPRAQLIAMSVIVQGDGTGDSVRVANSGRLDILTMWIQNRINGIVAPNDGGTPTIVTAGILFDNCTKNFLIQNANTVGHNDGYTEYTKTTIPNTAPFFIANTNQQIITIAAKGADFTSIAAALASIADNAPTRPYVVSVGPGIFYEPPIVCKPFVSIIGQDAINSIIVCINPTGIAVSGTDNSLVRNLAITNAAAGGTIVYYTGSGLSSPFFLLDCIIGSAVTGIRIEGNGYDTQFASNNVVFGNLFDNTTYVYVSSVNSTQTSASMANYFIAKSSGTRATTAFRIAGVTTRVNIVSSAVNYGNTAMPNTTAISVENGADVDILSCAISGVFNGVINPYGSGAGCDIAVSGVSFQDTTYFLRVENAASTGGLNGNVDITKMYVNRSAAFSIAGRDPAVVGVGQHGGYITTVGDALDYINPTVAISTVNTSTTITSSGVFNIQMDGATVSAAGVPPGTTATFVSDSAMTLSAAATSTATVQGTFVVTSETRKYIIQINPGIYVEANPIVVLPYISLVGQSNTYLVASDPFSPILVLSSMVTLRSFTVVGAAAPGGVGILVDSAVGVYLAEMTAAICNVGVMMSATTSLAQMVINGLMLSDIGTYGLHVDGTVATSAHPCVISTGTMLVNIGSGSPTVCLFEGPYSQIIVANTNIVGTSTTNGMIIQDGAAISMATVGINGCAEGIRVANVGSAPNIAVTGTLCRNIAGLDLNVLHPGTTGVFQGIVQRSKTFVDPSSTLSIQYLDPDVNGTTIVGGLYLGRTNGTAADMLESIDHVNLVSGSTDPGTIVLTPATGLNVNVPAGTGYLSYQTSPHVVRRYEWSTQVLAVAASSTLYVYIDINGALTSNAAPPNPFQSILLGVVRTTVSGIELIDAIGMNTRQISNRYDQFHRNAIGAVVANGLLTTSNTSRQLSVGSGQYYYSGDEFNPSGSSGFPLTFNAYYHASGVFTFATNTTVVSNTQYDNGTDLVSLTASYYAKHSLYMVGDATLERYMLVYSQAEYVDLMAAQAAPLPMPPNYFTGGIILIASIVVQQGVATYAPVVDQRPTITTNVNSVTATLIHGNLLGLGADDHCFTDDTELLTESGFIKYTDIVEGQTRALTLNIETDKLEYNTVKARYVYDTFKEVVSITNRYGSIRVTKGHTMLYCNTTNPKKGKTPSCKYLKCTAEQAMTKSVLDIPISGIADGVTYDKPLALFTLIGLIISDGGFCDYGIRIYQNYPQSEYVKRILDAVSADYTENTRHRGGEQVGDTEYATKDVASHVFYIRSPWCKENILEWVSSKKIGEKVKTLRGEQFLAFMRGMIMGDGSVHHNQPGEIDKMQVIDKFGDREDKHYQFVYHTADKQLCDDVCHVLTLNGFKAYANHRMTGMGANGMWSVNISPKTKVLFNKKATKEIIPYNGNVWCGSVDNKTLVVRRNGFIYIAGNTQYLLCDGSRAMSSDLNVGGFNITNVALVDGVDVSAHASRHQPNGADPIPTAAPIASITAGTANSVGTANTLSRSDHGHGISTGSVVSVGTANAAGAANSLSRSDHVHQGVHSLKINGGATSFGAINIVAGSGITLADNAANQYTVSLTSPVTIALGGTNSTTALNNNRIMQSIAGALVEAAALTNGQLLIGSTGAAPAAASITAGTGIQVTNGAGTITVANTGVTSVGLSMPAEFSVASSPVTTTGTIAVTKATQTANTVYAGPTSGGAAVPAFRALVTADIAAIAPQLVSLNSVQISVGTAASTIAYFPWSNARMGGYAVRRVALWVVPSATVGKDMTVNVLPNGGGSLGSITIPGGSVVGAYYSFTFTNPGVDTRLDFVTSRTGAGGTNPLINGLTLELSSS